MRVLLVEDDPVVGPDLVQALTEAGFVVDLSCDGEDAWYRGVEDYVLAVLDLGLPKLDGLSVLKRWRSEGRDFPVLILSARSDWTEKVEAGEGRIAMAIEPALSLPTGNHRRGLGDGHAGIVLPLILGYKTGAWELGGELGYEHVLGTADHDGYAGLLAMRRVTPALRLGAELVVEAEVMNFQRLDTRASAGFKLRIGKNSEIQGLFGRMIHTADHRAASRFKVAYEFKW